MKLTKFATAIALAIASITAHAIPLNSINGSVNWKLAGLTTESNLTTGTNETTWGVGAITSLSSSSGNWAAGLSDGSYLYYMIYGIADQNIVTSGSNFDIYNVGATGGVADGKIHMDIYRSNTQIAALDQNFNANPANRTSFNSYSLLAALGPAYLKAEMNPGKQLVNVVGGTDPLADETLASLVQHVFSTSLPTDGQGSFFADVVGGTATTKWDTNGFFGHDFDAKFTLSINGASYGTGTCTDAQVAANTCFAGYINDPLRSVALPEPGSMALVGLGLLGLGALRRRKGA